MTDELRQEYESLFQSATINDDHSNEVDNFVSRLTTGQARYEDVSNSTMVPWFVIGLIHGLECDFNFGEHLHNGDSLKHRTVNEPSGRPPPSVGNPPFDWKVSAIDALQYDSFTSWNDWTIAGICYKLEGYNGWGYRRHGINSPYLWSYSSQYERGKYTSDGHFDPDAVSRQVGTITALKRMVDGEIIALPASSA